MKTTAVQADNQPQDQEESKELQPTGVTIMGDSSISFQKKRAIRTRDTVRPKTQNGNRSYYEDIKEKMKKLEMPLWNNSATSWLRNVSPSYCIPKAQRFTSLDEDRRKNGQFLKLNLASQINKIEKGKKFPLSKRVNHFLQKSRMDQPSPANYHTHRFLDNSSYKIGNKTNSFTTLPSQSSSILQKAKEKSENPEHAFHYENTNHTIGQFSFCRFDELRGRTMYKFDKYHKQYLDHGKQFAYNQHYGQGIPGVGAYVVDEPIGRQKASFSMRKVLYRFNQRIKAAPGPSDYKNDPKPAKPSTLKQTMTNSRRLDLSKPLNTTPGPAFYSISRYLQKSS